MTRLSRRTFLSIAAASAAMSAIASSGALGQEGPVRIALICPLSGPQALLGPSMQAGAQIMVDQINAAGGINGRQLELVVRDDSAKAEQTLVAFRELVGEGVNFFLIGPYSGQQLAVQPLLEETNTIMIGMGGVGLSLTHELFTRNYFRQNANAYSLYHGHARAMAQKFPQVTKWASIYPDLEAARDIIKYFNQGLTKYYAEDAGVEATILEPIVTKPGATDYRAQISQLMSSDADGLVVSLFGADCITFLNQARGFGLDQKFKVINDTALSFALPKALKADIPKNLWVSTQWYPEMDPDNALSIALFDEYLKRTSDPDPLWHVGICASIVCSFADAVKAAGTTDTAAVIDALETVEISAPTGKVRFRTEDHQVIDQNYHFVEVVPAADDPKGWAIAQRVLIPAEDLLETPTPGSKFEG